ncbi:T9SS type A sorting domain-containing protein [Taibaiella lutea]|uniref:T9SS type A sorting domain-containing protein n=1 Tax=Taibaiella lutea TaxID=2608001 RepID=A0A5M6CI36_9BACT|nr:T9SS type A sorting domain-containing protein [Taibaiella lutea]KAA5534871.1 T9SS type A sorting domain-containing protein [Taibaiella lutea]
MISKKILLLCAAVGTLITNSANAQVFISQDFDSVSNPALPTGWASSPASLWVTGAPDNITPNALSALNFSLNNPAHTKAIGIDGTQATADAAILSLPTISLPASAVNAILEYDVAYFGIQSNATPPETESLILIVSTDGGGTWSDVSFVAPLSDPASMLWETRSLPVGTYAGQSNLKFGFRYNNQGGNLIGAALDNIKLVNGIDGKVITAFAGDHPDPSTGIGYQFSGSSATLTGTVKNTGSVTINSYHIKYKVGTGAVQSSSLISTPLAPLASVNFPAGLTVAIPANNSYSIKAWIEAAGDVDHTNDTTSLTTVGIPYLPVKRPLFEEGTGTWCGWCPRGAVFMDKFHANHSNGVASQIAVHNNDPMMVADYNSYMANYAGGFPNLVIDRTIVKDPRDIDSAFIIAQNNFSFADFIMDAPIINGNTVSIPVAIKPVVTITNPKLALVITESNVKGSGSNWPQNNYYSGGGSGVMGGWENEASHVDGVYFHFVARSITPSAGGNSGHLPSTLVAGTVYRDTLTATLNSEWKTNNLQYVALFINGNNTSVMNTASSASPTLLPALGNSTAITNIESGIEGAAIYPNPTSGKSYLSVKIKDEGKTVLTVSDIAGRKLFSTTQQMHSGNNTVEIETGNLATGSYFITFTTEKENVTLRLQVVK